jgi:hypothetical protein
MVNRLLPVKLIALLIVLYIPLIAFGKDYIDPNRLPKVLNVAICYPNNFSTLPSKERDFINGILKENIKLVLYSKGYKLNSIKEVRNCSIDKLQKRFNYSDGILAIRIKDIQLTFAIVAQNYYISADVYLINNGQVLKKWFVETRKAEVNVPLSILDVAKVFFKTITYDNQQVIYNLLQVFVRKLALQLPDLPAAEKTIKVYYVNWIINSSNKSGLNGILKRGDTISLLLEAEPNLKGELILQGIRDKTLKITLNHLPSSPNIYIGIYKIRYGDYGTDVAIKAILTNRYGDSVEIRYPKYLQVDAIPPLPPVNLKVELIGHKVL